MYCHIANHVRPGRNTRRMYENDPPEAGQRMEQSLWRGQTPATAFDLVWKRSLREKIRISYICAALAGMVLRAAQAGNTSATAKSSCGRRCNPARASRRCCGAARPSWSCRTALRNTARRRHWWNMRRRWSIPPARCSRFGCRRRPFRSGWST